MKAEELQSKIKHKPLYIIYTPHPFVSIPSVPILLLQVTLNSTYTHFKTQNTSEALFKIHPCRTCTGKLKNQTTAAREQKEVGTLQTTRTITETVIFNSLAKTSQSLDSGINQCCCYFSGETCHSNRGKKKKDNPPPVIPAFNLALNLDKSISASWQRSKNQQLW